MRCAGSVAASTNLTPAQRTLRASAAAHASWANTTDRAARTEPARRAALAKFEDQVDPERKLEPEERTRRALSARRAHYRAMALKSARVRSRGRAG